MLGDQKMQDLKRKLVEEGYDISGFRSLREVATDENVDLSDIEESEVEKLNPIPLIPIEVSKAMEVWESLHKIREKLGYYPVILGSRHSVNVHWENREDTELPQTYLRQATDFPLDIWIETSIQEHLPSRTNHNESGLGGKSLDSVLPAHTIDLSKMYSVDETKTVYIGFFATTNAWEIPAHLGYGCWNDCPCPEVQVAFHKTWFERYHMEPLLMGHDTLVCRLAHPPKSRDEALRLAREHFAYCSDSLNILQTLDALAAHLLNSSVWSFWWD